MARRHAHGKRQFWWNKAEEEGRPNLIRGRGRKLFMSMVYFDASSVNDNYWKVDFRILVKYFFAINRLDSWFE